MLLMTLELIFPYRSLDVAKFAKNLTDEGEYRRGTKYFVRNFGTQENPSFMVPNRSYVPWP